MFSFNYNIVYFTLYCVFRVAYSLVELPAIEDNEIAITETAIRNTVNDLFSTFKVRGAANRPKLKKYSVIHNFFVSITLKDCDNLKKIVQLSRLNDIDNSTLHFIAQINEVFDETDNKSNEATDDIYVNMHIEKFIKKLRDLKQIYQFNEYFSKHDINEKIIEHLSRDGTTLADVTNGTNKTTDPIDNNDDEVWTPVLQSGRRIFHGHRTHITHYPFMASVQLFDRFHCAGSIIRTDLVITAASCLQLAYNNRFFRENPAFLSVQIGSDYYEEGGENIPVLEVYFHYEYDPRTLNNNIALMRLTTHIIFSKKNKKVKRIDFDENDSPLAVDTNGIIIVGWGAKDSTGNIFSPWENRLTYAQLDYYPMSECQEIYTKDYVTKKHFCAGFFTKPTGACQHDVGGPGIYRGYLVGVISFGPPICGTPDAPTVFTKVGFYKDWINKIIDTPAPYYKPLTTLLVTHNTFKPVYTTKTTKPYMMQPIINSVLRRESLRILEDDKLFKDFVSTMFKQKGINRVQQADENIEQKELLRQKHTTETPTTDINAEITEPDKTTTDVLSQGYIFDDVANKFLDFLGLNSKPTTTETSIIEVIENQVNIDIKPNTKLATKKTKPTRYFEAYSNEDSSGDSTTKYFKLYKAKSKSTTASTYPLFVGIEYNDDNSGMARAKFKANDQDYKLKNDDSSMLELDDDRNQKIPKQGASKVKKAVKVKGRASVTHTRKPENSESADVIGDNLVKKYENTDNGSELDIFVKDILDYVKDKPIEHTTSKKGIKVKKARSNLAATTPLFKESVHIQDNYNKRLRVKNKMSEKNKKVNDDLIFDSEMTIKVNIDKGKVSKLKKIRTAAAADVILSPNKSEYENEDSKEDEPKLIETDDENDFTLETGKNNLAKENKDTTSKQFRAKKIKRIKNRNMTFTTESVNSGYEDNTVTSAKKKTHNHLNKNVNPDSQLDSLVKGILDYVERGSMERIVSKKYHSGKTTRNRDSTATTRFVKKTALEPKKQYVQTNEDITGDSISELDIDELKDITGSPTVKKSFEDEVEYNDDNSKIIEPNVEVTEIQKKSKHKYAADENINDYSILETKPTNLDLSKEKTLRATRDKKLHRGKPRSSKHLHKHKPKHATDSTVSTDKTEYEDEDGELDIKTSEVSKHSTKKKSNIDDDNDNDTTAKKDGNNDSKLEKDITELLDELDLQKIIESAENTVQKKNLKKKNIKSVTEEVKDDSEQSSSQSHSGDSSSETSQGMQIE